MPDRRSRITPGLAALACASLLLAACGERTEQAAPEPTPAAAPQKPSSLPAVQDLSKEVGPAFDPVFEILDERDPFVRIRRLAEILPTLDPSAVGQVAELVTDPSLDLGVAEVALLVESWAVHDAKAAAHWALFDCPHGRKAGAIESAFTRLAGEDPQAAIAELRDFLAIPGPFGEVAEVALVRGWFASGKPGLVEYIHGLGLGFNRQRAVSAYARALAKRDGMQAALAWAESIPDDDIDFQKDALRQTGWAVSMLDPVAAAKWCDRVCPERPEALSLRAMIAQRWGAIDGPAAMEWVSQPPLDREQRWAVKGAFNGWWVEDREGFEKWLDELAQADEVDPWLHPALEIYAASISTEDPRKALAWAARIEDPPTQERTLMNVARMWRRADQAAADEWLEQSPLSEESRQAVRDPKSAMPVRTLEPEPDEAG
jgi:hypothetical protein